MKITWQKNDAKEVTLKNFLLRQGVSQRLYGKIKKGYGTVYLDGVKTAVPVLLPKKVELTLELPPDPPEEHVAPSFAPITILYEDEHWIVVDKSAGLTSVPGPSNQTDTLVNRVKGYLITKKDGTQTPRIITRLDRYTSGVVLFAKHSFGQTLLAKQKAMLDKRYLALVFGKVTPEHGLIEEPLGRLADSFCYGVVSDGKPAKTEYWVKGHAHETSLVAVKLHTGRTHQIRVHFSANGHPLLGDKLYGGSQELIARQALHAQKLDFIDPFTAKKMTFEAPLPPDMQTLIEHLEL